MKNLKKVLALVVVFSMMLGTVAFAAFPDVAEDADYSSAVNTLAALDIIGGDDQGNFNPDNTITRAEVTKIICEMQGLKGDASKGATIFTDVAADHWASGYINMATNMGIVNGMGDGTFAPDAPVTYEQVVKMIVVALGYAPMAADKGGYPTGHLVVAQSAGVTKNVAAPAQTDAAKRALVAQLVYNALDVPMMEKTGFGTNESYEIMDGTGDKARNTLLTTKFDVIKLGGVVIANEKVALEDVDLIGDGDELDGVSAEDEITLAYDNSFKTTNEDFILGRNEFAKVNAKVGETNAADFFGQRVIAYIQDTGRNYEVIAIVAEDGKNASVSFGLDDIDTGSRSVVDATPYKLAYYESDDARKSTQVKVNDSYVVIWNSVVSSADLEDIVAAAVAEEFSAKVELIDWDADDKFDLIKVDQYAHYVVEEIDAEDYIISTIDGSEFKLDEDTLEELIVTVKDVNGDAVAFEDIAVGDVLAVIADDVDDATEAESFIDITVLGQTAVEGTVKSVAADGKVTIDGTKYQLDAACYNGNKIAIGSEGSYYLGIAGQIVAFDGSKAASGNYAIILETAEATTGFDEGIQVKVLNKNGEVVIYNVGKKIKIKNADGMAVSYDATVDALENLAEEGDPAFYFDLAGTDWADYATETNVAALLENFETEPTVDNILDRLVQIKVNSSNEITEITPAGSEDTFEVEDCTDTDKTFSATTGRFSGIGRVDEGTLIFNINWNDLAKSKIITVDSLLDDADYKVAGIDKDNGYYAAMIIVDGGNSLAASIDGMAVVTAVSETRDADDNDAYAISFVENGEKEEKTILVTADTDVDAEYNGSADAMDLVAAMGEGSLFLYAADADGNATAIASIANIAENADGEEIYVFVIDEDGEFGPASNATTFIYGCTTDEKMTANSIETTDGEIEITAGVYKYTFNNTGKTRVEVGSYKGGDVDEADETETTLFVARLVDGETVDVIAIGARVTTATWDVMD
ncbi:MAG: S-layer homology domain-containing protein [Clostridia bacterium]|nr:S-layer homology domain-containing protein [Clostridia bacterium]